MFQVQIQEPASRSIITRAFIFLGKFIIAKYLEQKVNGDLSICVDERSCYDFSVTGDKDLSKSHDQKVMMLLPIMENCPMDFYQGVVLLLKFDNSTPLWLEIKRFVKVTWLWGNAISTSWGRVPNVTHWMNFTCCPSLIFLASPRLEIY